MTKKIIGYTTGVFDLFHVGHLNIFKKAKAECDELIVAVTTDEYTLRVKGKYPVIPYDERIQIIAALKYVDRVVPQDIGPSEDFLGHMTRMHEEIGFQKIFKGSDVEGTEKWIRVENYFQKIGVSVIFFPYTMSTSSTIIRKKISEF